MSKVIEKPTSSDSHNNQNGPEFIVTYKGEKYNVARFLNNHPGTKEVILPFKDKDMTQAFDEVGHSETALNLLARYAVKKEGKDYVQTSATTTKYLSKKLFTHEDKFLVHKTLGFLALVGFIYRYLYLFPTEHTLGFTGTVGDYGLLIIHFGLSLSALIFHVIPKRMPKNPLIIYEEYRLHAIVFTIRSVGMATIGIMHWPYYYQLILVTLVHLAADYITHVHGSNGVTAVRNTNEGTFKSLRLFFSYYQFAALGSHLLVDPMIADLGYNTLIAVQSSAFLMTLKRKSLINWSTYLLFYSIALALSLGYMWYTKGALFFVIVGSVFLLRVKFNINKYILWTGFVLGSAYIPHFVQ